MSKRISLAMGNGAHENRDLINSIFFKAFDNEILKKGEDSAIIEKGQLAFTTDSFTVTPLFFSGGNIGKLAICGTCNDLAMMCAKPKYLTCAMVIEEGFLIDDLKKIVKSMQKEVALNEALIVSGDTKVMPKGSLDKIIINTSGIGEVLKKGISALNISEDDAILVSRDIGAHGATIFSCRKEIAFESSLKSDCTSLFETVKELINADIKISALRDATRGGIAATLNEWAYESNFCIEINEEAIAVSSEVKGVCELLGFQATSLANEGTFCLAIAKRDAQKALDILKTFNTNAAIIGNVTQAYKKKVILKTNWGTKRFLDMPTGELLPRIC